MSVIGIDFGNESCYVAVARAGGIETIANDYSLRATPSCVAFSGKNRLVGVAAKNQMVTNMKNTICGFKRLLGRTYNDQYIHPPLKDRPYRVEKLANNGIGIRVNYLDEEIVFTPQQITAMLFTKLKDIAETALKAKVNDCVISVPSFFTNIERKALLDAATIAGLNVLRLMNETTATALAYGIYKQDLPSPEERPRNVVFVDCGYSSLQVSACALHKGKLKMLACASDPFLGGSDFDEALAKYFCADFHTRYHIDPRTNVRAYLRLITEVEKLKKQMSANSTKLPLNIECFMNDLDVHGEMKREDMEVICSHLLERAERTLRKCLDDSKLRPDEIYAVEIVGGSSRIPAIKNLIESVFGKHPSTTLNQDEAVARGCALQCAMLSPAIRVREFNVTDVQNYAINLEWEDELGGGEMELFPQNHPVPYTKMLTFFRTQPFTIKACYGGSVPIPDLTIGHVVINGVRPSAEGESQKVKVKVRIDINGILVINSAEIYEKREPGDQDNEESEMQECESQKGLNNDVDGSTGQQQSQQQQSQQQAAQQNHTGNEEDPGSPNTSDKQKKKKSLFKIVGIPVDQHWRTSTHEPLDNLVEMECKMIASDRQEKERVDARNALEEYVYELRGKVSSEDELASYVTPPDRDALSQQLDNMEVWLYEEGEDCNKQIYVDKLASLKNLGEPIEHRRSEYEAREGVLNEYSASLQLSQKTVDHFRSGDERFIHLKESDVQNAQHLIDKNMKWLDEKRMALAGTPRTQDPPITMEQIRRERQTFLDAVNPLLNQQKPEKMDSPTPNRSSEGSKEGQGDQSPKQNQTNNPEEKMDVE
ncbi:heat shock 70 kDa protein 4L [Anabrus simplex]|uniref:heat shock 70 kDa protein 4L n=1 Tax=Anabrus simplex TaxID=316456 RepID=UPI0035A36B97